MTRRALPLFIIAAVFALAAGVTAWRISGGGAATEGRRADRPLSVETVLVRVQPMPVSLQSVGQVQAEHSVQIRPQVSGLLQQVYFTEGQAVAKGQRLFRIDPEQYEAALNAARAEAEYAEANAKRLAPLVGPEYVTSQEYDNARAAADQARAALRQAEINLAYTDIRAPIAGRTGSLGAKPGNLVAPTDSAPLVLINQISPILVEYTIPQQMLAELRRYQAQGGIRIFVTNEDGSGEDGSGEDGSGEDGSGDLGAGELVFVDNAVNTDTGTVLLKARLPNKDERLWPGQYVGVRTQLTLQPDAMVVPQSAVQTGQDGNFVYLVDQGEAAIRPVQVDRQDGDVAVIASGLEAGETVVTRAPRNLRPGLKVVPVAAAAAPRAQ